MLLDLEYYEAEAKKLLPNVSEGPKNVRMTGLIYLRRANVSRARSENGHFQLKQE
jgi:hypothetical protein